jgi:nucleotide-binding universal stress UspA family protein
MFQRILAPIDGSKCSERALAQATRIARAYGGQLRLVHVFTGTVHDHAVEPGQFQSGFLATLRGCAEGILTRAFRYVAAQHVPVEQVLVDAIGDPAHESIIVEAKLWRADLIVMGAHGQRGIRGAALGTDASAVLRKAQIPVLLVRSGASAPRPIELPTGGALRLAVAH